MAVVSRISRPLGRLKNMETPSSAIGRNKLAGLLFGTAVGDAIGLPFEGLSARRVARRLRGRALDHRLLLGRGMRSDDTEHACLVAQSLLECPADPAAFQRALARRLRWWLAGVCVTGLLFGWAQLARGAHFASHTLWSAWLCWAVCVASARARAAVPALSASRQAA